MKSFIIFPLICLFIWTFAILTLVDAPKQKKYKIILSAVLTCVFLTCVMFLGNLDKIFDHIYIDHNATLLIFSTVFPLTYLINTYLPKTLGLIFIIRLAFTALLSFGILNGLYYVSIIIALICNPENLHK